MLVQTMLPVTACAASLLLGCGDRTGLDDGRIGSFGGSSAGGTSGSPARVEAGTGGRRASTVTPASGTTAGAGTIASAGSTGEALTCAESACGELCVLCGGDCVDEQIDTSNCGACGIVCSEGMLCAHATCVCRPGWLA